MTQLIFIGILIILSFPIILSQSLKEGENYDYYLNSMDKINNFFDIPSIEMESGCIVQNTEVLFLDDRMCMQIRQCEESCSMRSYSCSKVDSKIDNSYEHYGVIMNLYLERLDYYEGGIRYDFYNSPDNENGYVLRRAVYYGSSTLYDEADDPKTVDSTFNPYVLNEYGILYKENSVDFYINGKKIGSTYNHETYIINGNKNLNIEFLVDDCWYSCVRGEFVDPEEGVYQMKVQRIRFVKDAENYIPATSNYGWIAAIILSILFCLFCCICVIICIVVLVWYFKKKKVNLKAPWSTLKDTSSGLSEGVSERVEELKNLKITPGKRKSKGVSQFEEIDKEITEKAAANLKINKELFSIDVGELKVLKKIGRGGFNTIYLCEYHDAQVAFKSFDTKSIFDTENSYQAFESELELISSLSHPGLCRFYGEYCSGGDIQEYIQANKTSIQEKFRFLKEIAIVMSFLHKKNVIHRDLKPENILLDNHLIIKIIDFGLSKMMEDIADVTQTRNIGDVYSYGIIMYCILSECWQPYGKKEGFNVHVKVSSDPEYRPELSKIPKSIVRKYDVIIALMKQCWCHYPENRLNFDELVDFFKNPDSFSYCPPKPKKRPPKIKDVKAKRPHSSKNFSQKTRKNTQNRRVTTKYV